MFVCMGNICRSPLAHGVMEDKLRKAGMDSEIAVESSGTISYHQGELPDQRMRQTAAEHGISLTHRARQFQKTDFDNYDLILAMDNENLSNILRLAPDRVAADKVKLFRDFDPQGSGEVPDPYYGGQKGFETVFSMVDRTCDVLCREFAKQPAE